jgi:phosphoserine aminotransferase
LDFWFIVTICWPTHNASIWRLQFAAVPLNLSNGKDNVAGDYIDTGFWSQRAINEAKLISNDITIAADAKSTNYSSIPPVSAWKYRNNSRMSTMHRVQVSAC